MADLSVITVVRNDLAGLIRTAESIAEQSIDVEWIVIDGASSDGSAEAEKGLAYEASEFLSEPDAGIYDAMNKGLQRATGAWIQFLNAGDTYCEESTLIRVNEQLDRTDRKWAFGAVRNIDESGRAKGFQSASPFTVAGLAFGNLTVPHQATFMSSDLVRRIGRFRTDAGTAADQEFILRAARLGEPEEIIWPLVDFRLGGAGMGHGVGHLTRSMHRFRRESRQWQSGSRITDSIVDGYVLGKRWIESVEERILRRSGNA